MIAVSNGNDKNTMIQCYRVLIHKQNDKLMITSQSLRSFFASEGAGRDINGNLLFIIKCIMFK